MIEALRRSGAVENIFNIRVGRFSSHSTWIHRLWCRQWSDASHTRLIRVVSVADRAKISLNKPEKIPSNFGRKV